MLNTRVRGSASRYWLGTAGRWPDYFLRIIYTTICEVLTGNAHEIGNHLSPLSVPDLNVGQR